MKSTVACFQNLCISPCTKVACFTNSCFLFMSCFYRFLLLRSNPLWVQIGYFASLCIFGFWVLKVLKPRTDSFTPRDLDLFFTSVSATTVSSMSTVEMEVFSNPQLTVMTILMFIGGEVFTSMLGLFFIRLKHKAHQDRIASVNSSPHAPKTTDSIEQIELGDVGRVLPVVKIPAVATSYESLDGLYSKLTWNHVSDCRESGSEYLWYSSVRYLGFVVLGYLLAVHLIGAAMLSLYLAVISSAAEVLKNKSLKQFTFSVFSVVSTFASCGFIPTNENMVVFSRNSGLLLILIPLMLLGNTLFPPCLRFLIWALRKLFKKQESEFLLKRTEEVGYKHLLPGLYSNFLVATVFGFVMVQSILLWAMDWDSEDLEGLNSYQKTVGVIFQTVNSRHTGETIMDLSTISAASLVLFVVMIAYGNVGFSMGYSCKRQLHREANYQDKWFGFAGRWSDEGKIILILVMLFGRLKKFNMDGSKAWNLL